MSACEKCWKDSRTAADPQLEYSRLVADRQCTPEEQAGHDAGWCPDCGCMTLHQHTREAMCGCDKTESN